jgi:metal-responsive CopG/Arc/MetJ family transcriptional regulator
MLFQIDSVQKFLLPMNEKTTKKRLSVSVDKKLVQWLDEQVKARHFANRMHGIEFTFSLIKQKIERSENIEYL